MNTEDATKSGIQTKNLPDTEQHINRVAGKMTANWKRFRVHLQSERTGITHLEEIYLSPEVKDNLLSYKALKRLGHVDDNHFRQPTQKEGKAKKKHQESTCQNVKKQQYMTHKE